MKLKITLSEIKSLAQSEEGLQAAYKLCHEGAVQKVRFSFSDNLIRALVQEKGEQSKQGEQDGHERNLQGHRTSLLLKQNASLHKAFCSCPHMKNQRQFCPHILALLLTCYKQDLQDLSGMLAHKHEEELRSHATAKANKKEVATTLVKEGSNFGRKKVSFLSKSSLLPSLLKISSSSFLPTDKDKRKTDMSSSIVEEQDKNKIVQLLHSIQASLGLASSDTTARKSKLRSPWRGSFSYKKVRKKSSFDETFPNVIRENSKLSLSHLQRQFKPKLFSSNHLTSPSDSAHITHTTNHQDPRKGEGNNGDFTSIDKDEKKRTFKRDSLVLRKKTWRSSQIQELLRLALKETREKKTRTEEATRIEACKQSQNLLHTFLAAQDHFYVINPSSTKEEENLPFKEDYQVCLHLYLQESTNYPEERSLTTIGKTLSAYLSLEISWSKKQFFLPSFLDLQKNVKKGKALFIPEINTFFSPFTLFHSEATHKLLLFCARNTHFAYLRQENSSFSIENLSLSPHASDRQNKQQTSPSSDLKKTRLRQKNLENFTRPLEQVQDAKSGIIQAFLALYIDEMAALFSLCEQYPELQVCVHAPRRKKSLPLVCKKAFPTFSLHLQEKEPLQGRSSYLLNLLATPNLHTFWGNGGREGKYYFFWQDTCFYQIPVFELEDKNFCASLLFLEQLLSSEKQSLLLSSSSYKLFKQHIVKLWQQRKITYQEETFSQAVLPSSNINLSEKPYTNRKEPLCFFRFFPVEKGLGLQVLLLYFDAQGKANVFPLHAVEIAKSLPQGTFSFELQDLTEKQDLSDRDVSFFERSYLFEHRLVHFLHQEGWKPIPQLLAKKSEEEKRDAYALVLAARKDFEEKNADTLELELMQCMETMKKDFPTLSALQLEDIQEQVHQAFLQNQVQHCFTLQNTDAVFHILQENNSLYKQLAYCLGFEQLAALKLRPFYFEKLLLDYFPEKEKLLLSLPFAQEDNHKQFFTFEFAKQILFTLQKQNPYLLHPFQGLINLHHPLSQQQANFFEMLLLNAERIFITPTPYLTYFSQENSGNAFALSSSLIQEHWLSFELPFFCLFEVLTYVNRCHVKIQNLGSSSLHQCLLDLSLSSAHFQGLNFLYLEQNSLTPSEKISSEYSFSSSSNATMLDLSTSQDSATTKDKVKAKLNLEQAENHHKNLTSKNAAKLHLSKHLTKILRPYQKTAVSWMKRLAQFKLSGILADDMGLGKTVQTLAFLYDYYTQKKSKAGPSLIIVPTALTHNWKAEAERFIPEIPVYLIEGNAPQRKRQILDHVLEKALFIVSYGTLRQDISLLKKLSFEICILDEAQAIKNPRTKLTRSCKQIKATVRFALTGTPIENRLIELWSIFDFLMPNYLYKQHYFKQKFELPIVKYQDTKALQQLQEKIHFFLLRRTKEEVLKDLPEKWESVISCAMSPLQEQLYIKYLYQTHQELKEEASLSAEERNQYHLFLLSRLMRLRQICCHPDLILKESENTGALAPAFLDRQEKKAVFENELNQTEKSRSKFVQHSGKIETLKLMLEESQEAGHRCLVFSNFTSLLRPLQQELRNEGWNVFYLDGQTSSSERLTLVNTFNERKQLLGEEKYKDVFLLSMKAGGLGLNLTGADTVFLLDPWWNPATENQAADRSHRLGQEKTVQVYRLITQNSIEEQILAMQENKKYLSANIMQAALREDKPFHWEEIQAVIRNSFLHFSQKNENFTKKIQTKNKETFLASSLDDKE